MTLRDFFNGQPRGAASKLAVRVGVTPTWMALITNGLRKPSLRLAVEIEKATDGAVTRQELRPDVFA
jgi:DNA-binding transcriptional regulator YdaS (Cro superfamily)